MQAQKGPVRMGAPEAAFQEISKLENVYGLSDNAANLADRSILLIGGWEDVQVTVDQTLPPLYRAFKRSKAADVTLQVYHSDHQFGAVRERLASDIRDWLQQHNPRYDSTARRSSNAPPFRMCALRSDRIGVRRLGMLNDPDLGLRAPLISCPALRIPQFSDAQPRPPLGWTS
jgi:hypothetical protein